MRFGLSLPHYGFSLADGAPISFEATVSWAERAEDMGFDSVWVSDHLFYSFGRYGADPAPIASLEALTTLAGVAARTRRVRVGTLVLCAPFRHPALLAKMASTIDGLSGGRLDLGVGAGWFEDEFAAFGYRFGSVGERFAALEETLQVVSSMFAFDEPLTLEGRTVSVHAARLLPRPVQAPIPIWVGGRGGPRMLRLAARHAAGWNVVWRMSPKAYAAKIRDVRVACDAEGRDPGTFRLSVGLYGVNGDDEAGARAAFERGRASFPGRAMDAEDWQTWRADTLSGSPDQVLERVEAFEELGVEEIVLSPWVLPFAVPEPDQVERFAERVIARIRA
jgi:probable F420-dependent oxidoreductase